MKENATFISKNAHTWVHYKVGLLCVIMSFGQWRPQLEWGNAPRCGKQSDQSHSWRETSWGTAVGCNGDRSSSPLYIGPLYGPLIVALYVQLRRSPIREKSLWVGLEEAASLDKKSRRWIVSYGCPVRWRNWPRLYLLISQFHIFSFPSQKESFQLRTSFILAVTLTFIRRILLSGVWIQFCSI